MDSAATLKPGQAAQLAKLAQERVAEERSGGTGPGPRARGKSAIEAETLVGGAAAEGDKPLRTRQQDITAQTAVERTEGGDAAVGSRAQLMNEMLRGDPPKEEDLKGPAPLTAAAGAPG